MLTRPLPYWVAVADAFDFDFGGVVLGQFASLGDAWQYARRLQTSPGYSGRDIRVTNAAKKHKIEYMLPGDVLAAPPA